AGRMSVWSVIVSSKSRDVGVRKLAVMDVHLAELGAAVQRGPAFAGIEQRVRIERRLDRKETLELAGAELDAHLRQLLDPDAVLAGDRPADLDAKLEDRGAERFGARHLALGIGIVEDQRAQISLAGMEHVPAAQSELHRQRLDSRQHRR